MLWDRAGRWTGVLTALVIALLLRAGQLLLVAWMGADDPAQPTLADRLLRWDAGWFINVAVEGYPDGYTYAEDGSRVGNGFAFFPLYPLLIRLVTATGVPPASASLLVAGVSGLAAAVLIYLLGVAIGARSVGYALLILVCAQPMAVSLAMGYSEPVFLALVAGALLAIQQRVWWAAGLAGLGAALTRPTGAAVAVALAVAVAVLWWRARRGTVRLHAGELPMAIGAALVALLAVPGFLLWVGARVGRWDAWFQVQTAGWGTTFDFGRSTGDFVLSSLRDGDGVVGLTTTWLIITVVVLTVLATSTRPPSDQLPLLVFGWLALVLALGQAGYWHSKPRLLVPVMLLAALPLAQTLTRIPKRTAAALLTLWAAFGLWFGAHMITVWPFTI